MVFIHPCFPASLLLALRLLFNSSLSAIRAIASCFSPLSPSRCALCLVVFNGGAAKLLLRCRNQICLRAVQAFVFITLFANGGDGGDGNGPEIHTLIKYNILLLNYASGSGGGDGAFCYTSIK